MASQAMSLQDMRELVRDTLDTDDVDLPDSTVDSFIIDAAGRIESHSDSWWFRQVEYTIATTPNQQAYAIRGSSLYAGIDAALVRVYDVRGPNWTLQPKQHRQVREQYRQSSTLSSTPTAVSLWGENLYLWPIPSEDISVTITGYREQAEWVESGGSPDFPDEFHILIVQWAISRAQAREGDPGMAIFYRDEFEAGLRRLTPSNNNGLEAQPLILGGGSRSSVARQNGLGPLIYPFD